MDRIQKLEAEIQRIKEEEANKKKAKYQYLVGQCLHRAHTSYEKITAIDRVSTDRLEMKLYSIASMFISTIEVMNITVVQVSSLMVMNRTMHKILIDIP